MFNSHCESGSTIAEPTPYSAGIVGDNENIFWNKERTGKRANDKIIYNHLRGVLDIGSQMRIFSMPATWEWEIRMIRHLGIESMVVDGIEGNKEFYPKTLEFAEKYNSKFRADGGKHHFRLPFGCVKSTMALGITRQQYDVVYLDYLGFMTESKMNDLRLLFRRKLFKNTAVFCLTVAGKGRSASKSAIANLVREYDSGALPDPIAKYDMSQFGEKYTRHMLDVTASIDITVNTLARGYNHSVELIHVGGYWSNPGHQGNQPMLNLAWAINRN